MKIPEEYKLSSPGIYLEPVFYDLVARGQPLTTPLNIWERVPESLSPKLYWIKSPPPWRNWNWFPVPRVFRWCGVLSEGCSAALRVLVYFSLVCLFKILLKLGLTNGLLKIGLILAWIYVFFSSQLLDGSYSKAYDSSIPVEWRIQTMSLR